MALPPSVRNRLLKSLFPKYTKPPASHISNQDFCMVSPTFGNLFNAPMDLTQLHKCRDLAVAGKWKDIENVFNRSIQLQHIGARVDLANPESPKAFIDELKDFHGGGIGTEAVNGGVIATLADLALGLLGLLHFKEGMTATAQLTVHYLKPFRTKSISAEATTQQVVGNRIFGTVELKNEKGDVCAIAYGALAKGISL